MHISSKISRAGKDLGTDRMTRHHAGQKVKAIPEAYEAVCALVPLYVSFRARMDAISNKVSVREPYQVLLDSQIIQDAARFKMRLGKMLENTLSGSIKPMFVCGPTKSILQHSPLTANRITQCSIRHLYNLPTTTDAEKQQKDSYIEVAKAAERRRCGHHELEEPLRTLECLERVVDPKGSGTNKHRYVVASQDPEVRARMREIAGVPLVYINRSVMILEPMARKTEEVREREEKGKIRAGLKGRRGARVGEKRKRDEEDEDVVGGAEDGAVDAQASKKKKVKGPKGPNPLSVKKAKKEKRPVAGQVEDDRAVIRKAAKQDPQAVEKAVDALAAAEGTTVDGMTEGPRKRKRKRKPKEGLEEVLSGAGVEHE